MYALMVKTHQPIFKAVFQHMLDRPGEPFLFHCTVGKDRTGVLAALIQSLAGTSVSDIQRDYALTRVGIEPVKGLLKQKAASLVEQFPEHPMIKAAATFESDAMRICLEAMERRHYGIEG
ncbi:hypothetical protein CLAFUW4_02472 [Fulvia fulva]|nr:hypothetical protein CLAFUR4_02467 [Fulvia fulva]KAK4633294.1 hypothetical protein CLAFUR0_02471 [Fulvia fulva]WPV10898.1 hypothetical protein CLAFUW4_02472 [Fulvia fulva]WPV25782.1 hypothetical protein CLAFUW7_02472 [Fulvia fulva]